ncbi:MAG: hypothetical protein ACK6BG_10985 [Cyanobacteriota bacterium]
MPPCLRLHVLGLLSLGTVLAVVPPATAQVESFMLKSGSQVGPATEVKPKNCVTAKDGTITCDTELVNPPGNTPAKPHFTPFRN